MVVVRENNEISTWVRAGSSRTPDEVAIQTWTTPKWRRTDAHMLTCAVALPFPSMASDAADRQQGFTRQLTLVAKTNVLTFAHDLGCFNEVARDYPEVKCDYQHVDACCMAMRPAPSDST
jgi:3-isopropylmalate dehydrogenase